MFTSLHALAKQATLMITIAAEGDDELRVNVTPVPADTKTKAKLPQPLSLRATPAEFDADFIAALATWQAPKRSLLQQAQDATSTATVAPAAAVAKPADKPQEKSKPGRKARAEKPGTSDPESAGLQAAGDATGAAGAAADEATGGADAAAGAPGVGADLDQVDTRTLDMFPASDAATPPASADDAQADVAPDQVAPLDDVF